MTKNLKNLTTVLIPLFLALVCGLFFCLTTYLNGSNSTKTEIVRTIEVTQSQINAQSVLDGFDNIKLETEGSLTTFEGTKTLDWSDFEELDNVSESDVESNIGCEVKYNVSYDAETNIVTLSASMENGETLSIENIYGSAFFDENGKLDAVMSLDGDCILLSEMQNLGMIENCGWFSNLFKKIIKVAVVVASVAVCVATAGMAVSAVIAIGAAISAAESVATQLLETGTVCLATLAIDTAIGAIPGGSGAKAVAKEGAQAFSKKVVKETTEEIVKKGVKKYTQTEIKAIKNTWGNLSTLSDHLQRHAKDFGLDFTKSGADIEYMKLANDFFKNKKSYLTKIDKDGIIRIYDTKTNTFGSYNPNGTTKTFYKPVEGKKYWDKQTGGLQ